MQKCCKNLQFNLPLCSRVLKNSLSRILKQYHKRQKSLFFRYWSLAWPKHDSKKNIQSSVTYCTTWTLPILLRKIAKALHQQDQFHPKNWYFLSLNTEKNISNFRVESLADCHKSSFSCGKNVKILFFWICREKFNM